VRLVGEIRAKAGLHRPGGRVRPGPGAPQIHGRQGLAGGKGRGVGGAGRVESP